MKSPTASRGFARRCCAPPAIDVSWVRFDGLATFDAWLTEWQGLTVNSAARERLFWGFGQCSERSRAGTGIAFEWVRLFPSKAQPMQAVPAPTNAPPRSEVRLRLVYPDSYTEGDATATPSVDEFDDESGCFVAKPKLDGAEGEFTVERAALGSASARLPSTSSPNATSALAEVRNKLGETLPVLQRRARYLARNPVEADDLVSDTVERALRFASGYSAGTNLKAWLLQIMYSVFASRCRRSQRERAAHALMGDDPNAWSHGEIASPEARTMLDGFVSKLRALPEAYAEVLWLVDYQDYAYSDAAEALGVPLGTVMSRLHRARRMMREALDPQAAVG